MDVLPFYRRVLGQMGNVLRPGGTTAMLVLREEPFNTAIRETEAFTIRHVRVIEIGGLYPHVSVLEQASWPAARPAKTKKPQPRSGTAAVDEKTIRV